jgi:GTP cyclohydrolase FolE2
LPTHSQRAITFLQIEDREEHLGFDDLFACLSESLHLSQDLLKRPDEAELVLKSHKQPQFAEDTVRKVAVTAASMFGDRLSPKSWMEVETISMESIHGHDVLCRLRKPVGHLSGLMS